MLESVIDFPKDGLCPDVWEKVVDEFGQDETFILKDEAKNVLFEVIQHIMQQTKKRFSTFHITGSITSNSYTENADIDLHFLSDQQEVDQAKADEINTLIRSAYKKTYIGKHPIEVYFQPNKFQDMMSVGCYDVATDKWIVGPELSNPEFNPYSEYYEDIKKNAKKHASKVRDVVLDVYEKAIVCMKSNGSVGYNDLQTALEEADVVYQQLRQSRKVYSSPTSEKQALQFRTSRKWKIADATFKLIDKFGYLAILKKYVELEDVLSSEDVLQDVASSIINTVKDMIGNKEKLADAEENCNKEELDEGILHKISLIALLAIPALMPAAQLKAKLQELPKTEIRAKSQKFQNAIKDFSDKKIGGFSITNAVNIQAWNLYGEAGNQSKRGKEAIASVILNRAGGDSNTMFKVILTPAKFSTWNPKNPWKLVAPKSDKDWTYRPPKETLTDPNAAQSWTDCVDIATRLMNGTFESTIGNRNSYLNKKTVKKTNPKVVGPNGWGTLMSDQIKIEDHTFGYLPENDGYKKNKTKSLIYVVKAGDTLGKIASKAGKTVDELVEINQLKNANSLKIGQTLKLSKDASQKTGKTITVKDGDSLWKIAKANGTTIDDIVSKNNISKDAKLKIGQKLKV